MIDGKELTLKEWKEMFESGEFDCEYKLIQIQAGWYDWFCWTDKLAAKTRFLGKKAIQLFDSPLLDKDQNYIWFKNYPSCGQKELIDDFRFADIESGDVKYTICYFKSEHYGERGTKYEVWDFSTKGAGSDLTGEPVVIGSWKEVKKFFKVA